MAEINTEKEAVSEIEKLKSAAPCKIIKNIGDFTFLITVTIPNTDIQIKFQLTAEYPKLAPTIFIRHPTMAKDEVQKVISSLPGNVSSLVLLFETIRNLIGTDSTKTGCKPVKSTSPDSPRRHKKNSGAISGEKEGEVKKPSMRTAADVIKRVQWDSSLASEKFIVGYLDRFLGIQEQPFNAFNWVNPAEADWMDLNIPEHRIEYFKYDGTIVWEKKSRLDNVFGSTGGITIDQMLSGENVIQGAQTTENGTSSGENIATDTTKNTESNSMDYTPSKAGKIHTRPQGRTDSKPIRNKPKHFIAIPIVESAIVDFIAKVQDEYITLSEGGEDEYMTELYNLHITLCAVKADTADKIDTVTQCVYELILELNSTLQQQQLTISHLESFGDRVLYAKAVLNEDFNDFVLKLRKMIVSKGIHIFDDEDEFVPHLTILKFPKSCRAIHFPINDFIAIRKENQVNAVELSTPLEQIALLSMERDDENHYIQRVIMDL